MSMAADADDDRCSYAVTTDDTLWLLLFYFFCQFSIYEKHRRLSIHSYSLHSESRPFGLHIRTLLGCFSDPLFIFPSLKLLRMLELSSESSNYWDRTGIQLLIHSKYLSVPRLPSSIGRLENLEFLLVERADYIPPVLLNMPKLRHLHVGKPVKFSKNCDISQMNSLQTLFFCSHFSFEG
ncbi:NB-ARC domain-containing protein [Abeliophyllum distichum]|uniref:NB-ARC domain-containing protein n=1 Tax=Abeliophyllum distichum TaxID=126358 RepID=A0ABD1P479_9LAMI